VAVCEDPSENFREIHLFLPTAQEKERQRRRLLAQPRSEAPKRTV
jgi:hypothetical protein